MIHSNIKNRQNEFDYAYKLHHKGRLEKAEKCYRKILKRSPNHIDAIHFLGLVMHQLGKSKEALKLIRRALELKPDYLDAHNNLGNILKEQGLLDEAESTYRHVVTLNPDFPEAHNNLGVLLKSRGNLEEAIESYKKAIELNPDYIDAFNNLAKVLSTLGRTQEAIEAYNYLLKKDPDNSIAQHMLAAMSGQLTPRRASDAYVQEVFDGYAETFDKSLKGLDYRAPQLVAEKVDQLFVTKSSQLKIFDAGCGTGLCAQYLKPYAAQLVGVDLSPAMVDKAKKLLLYDELIVAELTNYLLQQNSRFDLIVSADTLCYFGALEEVVNAANQALRNDAYLIFTVEHSLEELGQGYKINPQGRYSHNESYVISTLKDAGFVVKSVSKDSLRKELGNPVEGLVVVAQKYLA